MEKKLPEIVQAPNVILTDTFVGVRDNGDGTFSDYRFGMQDVVNAVLGANVLAKVVLDTPAVENGQVTLYGTSVAGAESYEIQVSTNASFIGAALIQTVDWPRIISLTNDIKYYFRARAVNATVLGPWSNTVSVTPSAVASVGFPYTFPITFA